MAITGPNWRGSLPARTLKIESPTNMVWLIGRTQTNGTQDYDAVHQIQKGYMLMPLDRYPDGPKKTEKAPAPRKYDPAAITPPVQVLRMTPVKFFNEFALLMEKNPPHQDDGPMMRDLARIGIRPGETFDAQALGSTGLAALEAGARTASTKLEAAVDPPSKKTATGWAGFGAKVGRYGTDYDARAIVARVGLGANAPEDAVYLNCTMDSVGKPLDGQRRYRMHFAKAEMPPVRAFWSVTMYDQDGYFVENPIQRYAIGDRDTLHFNADGSLDLNLSRQAPQGGKTSNWLPAPAGSFNLTFRLYWPKDEVLQAKWIPPAVQVEPFVTLLLIANRQAAKTFRQSKGTVRCLPAASSRKNLTQPKRKIIW